MWWQISSCLKPDDDSNAFFSKSHPPWSTIQLCVLCLSMILIVHLVYPPRRRAEQCVCSSHWIQNISEFAFKFSNSPAIFKTLVLTYRYIANWCFIEFKSGFFKQTLAPLWAASSVESLGCSPYTIGGEFIILPTAARHSSNFKQKRTLQNRHAKFPKLARFSKILLICLVLVLRGWLAYTSH